LEEVAFFALAIGALGGAIAVVGLRNPFYSVLFLLLHAEFIAAAQVVVYAGAVMVLYVFVAAYVGNVQEPIWDQIPGQRFIAPVLAAALFVELAIAVIGTGLKSLEGDGPTIPLGFGSPASIGELLLERYLIVFEAASMLLLIAAVGAVVLAGRRKETIARASGEAAVHAHGPAAPLAPEPDDTPREAEDVVGVIEEGRRGH
jgi:NADH:ubiquinone oxidoreductase subunit 6 (subunit J)